MPVEFAIENPFPSSYEGHVLIITNDFHEYQDFEGPSKIMIRPGANKFTLTIFVTENVRSSRDIQV